MGAVVAALKLPKPRPLLFDAMRAQYNADAARAQQLAEMVTEAPRVFEQLLGATAGAVGVQRRALGRPAVAASAAARAQSRSVALSRAQSAGGSGSSGSSGSFFAAY